MPSTHTDEIFKYFTGLIDTSEDIRDGVGTKVSTRDCLGKRSSKMRFIRDKPSTGLGEDQVVKIQITEIDGQKIQINLHQNLPMLDSIKIKERPHESKNSRLRTSKSFKFCIDLLERPATAAINVKEKSHMTVLQEIRGNSSFEEAKPIIVVPSAAHQGNLCLRNALDFFEKGSYKSVENTKKIEDSKVQFKYQINDEDVLFEVTDDVATLKANGKM